MAESTAPRRSLGSVVVLVSMLISACGGPSVQASSTGPAQIEDRIGQVATQFLAETRTAGMSIAVAKAGQVIFAEGYGFADLRHRIPSDRYTVFRIGSVSKQFTAAAIMQLIEQGRVALDSPVTDVLDLGFVGRPPTVRELLSHTGGLTDAHLGPMLAQTSAVGATMEEAIDLALAPGPAYSPGEGWEYSNGDYVIAYRVVEELSGQTYRDYLTDSVLAASGLTSTFLCPSEQPSEWAQGYEVDSNNWSRAVRLGRPPGLGDPDPINMDIVNSVCSTASDLVRWSHALKTGVVVSPASYSAMASPTVLADGTPLHYGLGLQLRRFGDHQAVAHGGIINGFVAILADFPDDDLTVAILVNTLVPEDQSAKLVTGVLGAVFEEPASQGWASSGEAAPH